MADHFRKALFHADFNDFVRELERELHKEGFVILSSTDIREILQSHLHAKIPGYKIISVMIPHLFNEMLSLQPFTGFVLPCHITVRETSHHHVEVAVADPSSLMARSVDDASLRNISDEIVRRLNLVIGFLSHKPAGMPDGLV